MAAGKSNSLAPTQAAAGNGNGVRFGVDRGERGGERGTVHTVPQLMLCPSNINNKHNSRRGNNNSNKSVTTAGTPRQGKEGRREEEEAGKTGKDKGKVSWEATKVQAQMTIDTSWQLAWGKEREGAREMEGEMQGKGTFCLHFAQFILLLFGKQVS